MGHGLYIGANVPSVENIKSALEAVKSVVSLTCSNEVQVAALKFMRTAIKAAPQTTSINDSYFESHDTPEKTKSK